METSIQVANRKKCRACLRTYESRKELISLFEKDQSTEIRFFDMLQNVVSHTLPESDALPSKICIMCLSSLRVSYFFRQEVEKSQKNLLNQATLSGIHIKVKEEPVDGDSFPVILRPRHVAKDLFNSSNIQDDVYMHSDGEIIDYEPDMESVANYSDSSIHIQPEISTQMDAEGEKQDFSCIDCKKDFSSYKAMQCHRRSTHLVKKCKYCDKKFGNKAQVKLHIKYKHADKYSEYLAEIEAASPTKQDGNHPVVRLERMEEFHDCSTCCVRFATKMALVKHHADCDSRCIDCGLKIPRKDFYFKHMETAHKYSNVDLTGYECPFCMNLFHSERILQDHIQRLHPDENQSNVDTFSEAGESVSNDSVVLHTCKICSQGFQSSKSLKQHTTLKHKEPRESVDVQPKTTKVPKYTKDEFFEKFIIKKSQDFLHCVPCKKDIFKRSLLLHVKSKHAAVRSYRCELCPEAFFRSDYRIRHFGINHPNDFKCTKCNVQFDRAHKFETHMVKHGHTQKRFKPSEADDQYDLSHNLIMYIEDSTNYDYTNDLQTQSIQQTRNEQPDELPLTKDEFCEKYFINNPNKTLKCTICNLELQRASLYSHLTWRHALLKPLKCSFCDDRVVKNKARLFHMSRAHPDEYKCFYCNTQFSKHHIYSDHMLTTHGEQVNSTPSPLEEEDLNQSEMRFVVNRNEDEVNEEVAEISLLEPPTIEEKFYNCQLCPKKFTSSKNLLIHKSHKHRNEASEMLEPTAQDISIDEPMSLEEFKQNWVEVMNATDLKCLVCEQVLKTRSLGPHLKAKHCTTGAYLCALCPESFYRYEQRIKHMSQNHRGIFFCDVCNIQFYRNSHYAKHMLEDHGIEIDGRDSYEVDPSINDLKFVPFVKKPIEDDQMSFSSSNINDSDILDPMEEMMQLMPTTEELSRNEFISKYVRSVGSEKHCLACDKIFTNSSIYHHLIHIHATVLPFKCPFCDVRFERSVTRSKHLQYFHPDDYKCNECGLQFQKHVKYSDHMWIEHNLTVTTPKSPYEEDDLGSGDLKYAAQKNTEEVFWQEEENSVANSTGYSDTNEYQDNSIKADDHILVNMKTDKADHQTISYVEDNALVEIPVQNQFTSGEEEMSYAQFREIYLKKIDSNNTKCLACNRILLRSSVGPHMRLWHAVGMMHNCEVCPAGFRRGDYRMRHMASAHPDTYKCSECGSQFYYSMLYKDHMSIDHKIYVEVPRLKAKQEIDVPLENMKFAPHIPEMVRNHSPEDTAKNSSKRRQSINVDRSGQDETTGYSYKIFYNKYIQQDGDLALCKACNQTFSKLSIKKHIKKDHATSKPYNCQLCDKGFYRVDDRVNHMKKFHTDSFKCLICDIQFYSSIIYINHMSTEHNMNVNIASNKTAEEIDIPFDRLRFLPKLNTNGDGNESNEKRDPSDNSMSREEFTQRFITRSHIDGELHLTCKPCKRTFIAKQKRFHLIHLHSKVKPFGCNMCSNRFMSNFKRVLHMKNQHPNDFNCQICAIQMETAEKYSEHMKDIHQITIKVSSNSNLDISGEDMRYFEKITKPRKMIRPSASSEVVDENSWTDTLHCDICKIDFDSSRSYRQHVRDHSGENGTLEIVPKMEIKKEPNVEKSFPCDMCDKVLSSLLAKNAHKKFKHGIHDGSQKTQNQKFQVMCEICPFTTYRRDYLEHHMKAVHRPEFACPHCKRYLSSYNYYIYHIKTTHFQKVDKSKLLKCPDCDSCFKLDENLQQHKESKHGENPPKRNNYCNLCGMDFRQPIQLKVHYEQYTHKNMENFFNGETSKSSIKGEPTEKIPVYDTPNESTDNLVKKNENHNEQSTKESEEPLSKRPKLMSECPDDAISESDKLEYLKYLQTTESGNFMCGICGKIKTLRKYMLHHLKQHKEVPTYNCEKCPERFVFKTKYDKHMELHQNGASEEFVIVNEHPKYQEVKKQPSEIKCSICHMTFKLTIILNKHNTTWHSDANPLKDLSMQEQKQRKSELSGKSPTDKRENVAKVSVNADDEANDNFDCDKCFIKFHDKKYLENHQKFFCVYRSQGAQGSSKVLNEQ